MRWCTCQTCTFSSDVIRSVGVELFQSFCAMLPAAIAPHLSMLSGAPHNVQSLGPCISSKCGLQLSTAFLVYRQNASKLNLRHQEIEQLEQKEAGLPADTDMLRHALKDFERHEAAQNVAQHQFQVTCSVFSTQHLSVCCAAVSLKCRVVCLLACLFQTTTAQRNLETRASCRCWPAKVYCVRC